MAVVIIQDGPDAGRQFVVHGELPPMIFTAAPFEPLAFTADSALDAMDAVPRKRCYELARWAEGPGWADRCELWSWRYRYIGEQ